MAIFVAFRASPRGDVPGRWRTPPRALAIAVCASELRSRSSRNHRARPEGPRAPWRPTVPMCPEAPLAAQVHSPRWADARPETRSTPRPRRGSCPSWVSRVRPCGGGRHILPRGRDCAQRDPSSPGSHVDIDVILACRRSPRGCQSLESRFRACRHSKADRRPPACPSQSGHPARAS